MFKAKLNTKFYFVFLLLLIMTVFCVTAFFSMASSDILLEDGQPMPKNEQTIFIALMSVILASWVLSAFSMLFQIFRGYGFYIDESGIHNTLSLTRFLAFVIVVPIKEIPFEAIADIENDIEVTTLVLDKSKLDVSPLFKPFINKRYSLFAGFTKTRGDEIKRELGRYLNSYNKTFNID